MDFIKNPSIIHTAVVLVLCSTILFFFGSSIGSGEMAFLDGIRAVGLGGEYWEAFPELSGSAWVLLGIIIGSLASVLIFNEFRVTGKENTIKGFFGGILKGFGMAMALGGSFFLLLSAAPSLSLGGLIAVMFMVMGIYIGGSR